MTTAFERAYAAKRAKMLRYDIVLVDAYSARWRNEWAKVDPYTPKPECNKQLNRLITLAKAEFDAEQLRKQTTLL